MGDVAFPDVEDELTLIAIPAGLLAAGLAAFAQAPSATKADTIDNTGGALAGQPMAGLIVAGKPCSFGDTYHYQITGRGELRGEGPITCPSASIIAGKVNGNELLCRLDAKLHCTARASRHRCILPSTTTA